MAKNAHKVFLKLFDDIQAIQVREQTSVTCLKLKNSWNEDRYFPKRFTDGDKHG